ncbi:MAG: hypothetical protein A3E87_05010 [Gammaproteobacteria bacterium RIFCSPHIGHO2_12_FULL_35_23]|nr:MAG: hypothetical protein A3E87_05010 [Gammaproteobacteria bacterium RIFCSPHIGHO2_12_FULL_35_23]
MNKFNFKFKKAEMTDAELLFAWRNNIKARQYSFNKTELEYTEHIEWLKNSLANKNRHILIIENDELKIGVLRIDIINDKLEVSIYLNPELYGQGYGAKILEMGIEYAKENFPEADELEGKIMIDNVASQKVFLKAGFIEKYKVMAYKLK